jgi:hypothetical protein
MARKIILTSLRAIAFKGVGCQVSGKRRQRPDNRGQIDNREAMKACLISVICRLIPDT